MCKTIENSEQKTKNLRNRNLSFIYTQALHRLTNPLTH